VIHDQLTFADDAADDLASELIPRLILIADRMLTGEWLPGRIPDRIATQRIEAPKVSGRTVREGKFSPFSREDAPWRSLALCAHIPNLDWANVDEFEPIKKARQAKEAEIAICNQCPVQKECLMESYRLGDNTGVWGGRTPRERKRTKK
jgi:Transcription factor WhiB